MPDREYYSAFQDIWGIHQTELFSLLQAKGVTHVFIAGLALDFCVLNSAVDSVRLGWPTFVIREATKPVDPGAWKSTEEQFSAAGVELIGLNHPLLERVKSLENNL